MINRGQPATFADRSPALLGLILEPNASQRCLWCAYAGDGDTMHPDPCADRSKAFFPGQFKQMLQQPQGNVHFGSYNEVILD